ncbi:flagellar basal body rod protein FlgB [Propionivibrio limicola]|uniref:flagellar basal body rod protein FlgB n=1 Tax=Propionivibrio limicola TaxID=167645 RepID=UPI001291D83D|nr:flagellar basal body rod protein FlgB [Propionivibrio limicola]
MTSKLDNAFSFQQQALALRAYRQQVLAGNIANADTPNYKARDFDFSSALQSAVAGRGDGALSMARTSSGHIAGGGSGAAASLMYRVPVQGSVDGNTVEMDVERAEFAENALQYQAGLTFISGRIKTMRAAIQGQ